MTRASSGTISRWPLVTLGTLAEFRNGVNFTKDNFGTGIRIVGVSDFQDHTVPDYSSLDQIDPEGLITDNHLLRDGDVVFVRSNGNRRLIGRSLFISGAAEPLTHSAFTIRARFASKHACPRFYAYAFRTEMIRNALTSHGGGTNISNLNQGILARLKVPLPPKKVQGQIASILSAYDGLIENNLRRIKILEEMAQSLYKEWFVDFRFPGHENAKRVDSPLGMIPEGWEAATVGEGAKLVSRGISPRYDDEGPVVVVNQRCIRNRQVSLADSRLHSGSFPAQKQVLFGDVLINSTGVGTLGRTAQICKDMVSCVVDSHVTIVRPAETIDMDYFGMAVMALESHFELQGTGATGQTELGRDSIRDTPLMLPPRPIQESFSTLVQPVRLLCLILLAHNECLRTARDLLLPKLISGELDVSDLDIGVGEDAA